MKNEQQLIRYWLKEDQDAIDLANSYSTISQTWDDLYDQDKSVSRSQVNTMMMLALIEVPRNRFFQQHYQELMPMVQHCLMTWLDANTLEEIGEGHDLYVSYIIRSVTTDLIIHLAGLVGGIIWRRQAALAIRQAVYRDNESFDAYREEILLNRERLKEGSETTSIS